MKIWNVGIYARVSSTKDEQKESISAQIQSLEEWIREKNNEKGEHYNVIEIFQDKGISGASFHRDSFEEMKRFIEDGKINMVLTRDLSRLGRNYVLAGYYLEDYFKVNGIRFVSVLDSVDTLEEIQDIVPFKNVLNEMYIKDCSRRSRDGLKQRMIRGSYVGSKPPYGYRKVTVEEKGQKMIRLVPDSSEKTAIVREIFHLYLEGWGYSKIANYLNEKKIPSPAALIDFPLAKWYRWNENGVKSILKNPKYGGIMVQGQYKKVSYKLKKSVKVAAENWIYSGEFTGIVSKDTFLKVQEEMERRKKIPGKITYRNHMFSGLMLCGDCGGAMGYQKKYEGYRCINSQRGGKRCTSHSIKEAYVKEQIQEDMGGFVKALEGADLSEMIDRWISNDEHLLQKNLLSLEKQLSKLESHLSTLYEDRLDGNISKEIFLSLSKKIEKNRNQLLEERTYHLKKLNAIENRDNEKNILKEKIERFLAFQELSRTFVERLIEKIIVFEETELKTKKIEIHYVFQLPEKV